MLGPDRRLLTVKELPTEANRTVAVGYLAGSHLTSNLIAMGKFGANSTSKPVWVPSDADFHHQSPREPDAGQQGHRCASQEERAWGLVRGLGFV